MEDDTDFSEADAAIAATEADIRYGGNRAFYDPAADFIQMLLREQFGGAEFHETIFHELVHWTEHPSRLDWNRSQQGKHAYSLGELIAEIGACYLCAELGVPTSENLDNHAAYLKSWLSVRK